MTPDKILEAKLLYKEHQNYSEVARIMNVASETIRLALNDRAKNLQKLRDKKRDFHSYYINKKNNDHNWYINKIKRISDFQKSPEGKLKSKIIYKNRKKMGKTGYKGITPSRLKHVQHRRAQKQNVKENYNESDMLYTRELFQNKCAVCDSTENICFDHWYPLSKGFPLTRENSVLLCANCNLSKQDKMPIDFFPEYIVNKIENILHHSHG